MFINVLLQKFQYFISAPLIILSQSAFGFLADDLNQLQCIDFHYSGIFTFIHLRKCVWEVRIKELQFIS